MIREYYRAIQEKYESEGVFPAIKLFGKTFGEYVFLETNINFINRTRGKNVYAIFMEPMSDSQSRLDATNKNLELLVEGIKAEFISSVK